MCCSSFAGEQTISEVKESLAEHGFKGDCIFLTEEMASSLEASEDRDSLVDFIATFPRAFERRSLFSPKKARELVEAHPGRPSHALLRVLEIWLNELQSANLDWRTMLLEMRESASNPLEVYSNDAEKQELYEAKQKMFADYLGRLLHV